MADDRMGRNALMYSCADANLDQFALLLAAVDDVDAQDNNGWTALHFATMLDDRAISAAMATALLDAGAHADIRDANGNTPINNAVFKSRHDYGIIRLLMSHGADPQLANAHGVSPLALAISMGDADLIEVLTP